MKKKNVVHNQAIKRIQFRKIDLMTMPEPKESARSLKSQQEAWLKTHKLGWYDKVGKLHRGPKIVDI